MRKTFWLGAGLLLGMGFAVAAQADEVWQAHPVTFTANSVNCAADADLDGDGRIDLVMGKNSNPAITWRRNDGNGAFPMGNTVDAVFSNPAVIVPANLDHAGGIDLIVGGSGELAWYENNGLGVFTKHTIDAGLSNVTGIQVVDLNADGSLDVVISAAGGNEIAWYENNGSQVFAAKDGIATLGGALAVAVVDIDNDGDLDLAAANSSSIHWYQNDGSENFTDRPIPGIGLSSLNSLAAADLDGDGRPDLAYASSDSNVGLRWLRNEGGGNTFTANAIFDSDVSYRTAALTDVNSDGRPDILAFDSDNGGRVECWTNNQGGTFVKTQVASFIGSGGGIFRSADLNGDGVREIYGTHSNSDNNQWDLAWFERRTVPGMTQIRLLPQSDSYNSLLVSGGYAYLGLEQFNAVDAFDIASIKKPRFVARYDQLGGSQYGSTPALSKIGDELFVSNSDQNMLQTLDVSNPARMALDSQWSLSQSPQDSVLLGDHLYLAGNNGMLFVFSVADAKHPTLVAQAQIGSGFSGVAASGHTLYLADGKYLTIADVSDPLHPALLSSLTITTRDGVQAVAVSGQVAVLACEEAGLSVVDVADPAHPAWLGEYRMNGRAISLAVSGQNVFVGTDSDGDDDNQLGIYQIDISAPAAPRLVKAYTWMCEHASWSNEGVKAIEPVGGFLAVAVKVTGLLILQWGNDDASDLTINQKIEDVMTYPNPARGVVRFLLTEPDAEKVRIEIYNLAGDRIATVAAVAPGQTVAWDANHVAAGIYLYRTIVTVRGQENKLPVKKLALVK